MAVDLMCFPKMNDQMAIQEAASQGLQSMEHMIRLLSNRSQQHNVDCSEITDYTVNKFKKVISVLNRTGHARFRRGPVHSPSTSYAASPPLPQIVPPASGITPSSLIHSNQPSITLDFSKPSIFGAKSKSSEVEFAKENFSVSLNSSYMSSGIIGDGSVSNGKASSFCLASAPSQPVISSGKPPLAGHPYRKRCLEYVHSESFSGKISGSGYGKCHCKKR